MIFKEIVHPISFYLYLSIYPSIYLSIHLSIHLYICLSIYFFINQSIFLSVYLGSGIITKEDEVEGVCQEIRLAVGRTSLIQVIQYTECTYSGDTVHKVNTYSGYTVHTVHIYSDCTLHKDYSAQGCNVRKVNCSFLYSAYILKPVLSGRNL